MTISRSQLTARLPGALHAGGVDEPLPLRLLGRPGRARAAAHPGSIRRYFFKLSGPLLDRIDIQLEVPRLEPHEMKAGATGESSEAVRERVARARRAQEERLEKPGRLQRPHGPQAELRRTCALEPREEDFILQAVTKLGLTARGHDRCLRIARTVADLAGRERIELADLAEAVQYRTLDRLGSAAFL